jgi:hypothetical protein
LSLKLFRAHDREEEVNDQDEGDNGNDGVFHKDVGDQTFSQAHMKRIMRPKKPTEARM